ncbi:MAG: class I SAM-dependent methyltransferase [Gammaproteobacteria bacterium]|nr:class I SAM-dependent methyltransferase [Gammaproteobacteria bacterium]
MALSSFLLRSLTRARYGLARLEGRRRANALPSKHRGPLNPPFLRAGVCDICEELVVFRAEDAWFRDRLHCTNCRSIPRERAFMRVLKQSVPGFAKLSVHESSPQRRRGLSVRLARDCPKYTCSHLYPDIPLGQRHPKTGIRCEDLECLTFPDESFHLFVTLDVLEHVFDAETVFKSIARVLKPGGTHIFTVPMVNKFKPSRARAERLPSGEIVHHMEPTYHGNPSTPAKRSLMTWNWGYDITGRIADWTGIRSVIVQVDDIDAGIRAALTEVVVSQKTSV